MKIGFVENRYKTWFWDAMARHWLERGHECCWLVQNPVFLPTTGRIRVMPFPSRATGDQVGADDLGWIRHADRNINYFAGDSRHYPHYNRLVGEWLDQERPDLVLGECTLFHELLVIDACKRRGIPFLHPSAPGYPGGRFAIYDGASKTTIGGCSKDMPDAAQALEIAEAIRRRERIPDYMKKSPKKVVDRVHPAPRTLADRARILRGRFLGERFNTPSVWRKLSLDRRTRSHLGRWEALAARAYAGPTPTGVCLYPLQMQPEANLDLWGGQHRNQAGLVERLARSLPVGWQLRVKANPKAKYELSRELLEVIATTPNVVAVPLAISIADEFARANLVCTVTGTVAVESVLSRIPLVQLGPGIVEDGPGCLRIGRPEDIGAVASTVASGMFVLADDDQRVELVQRLFATTFPGLVSDPSTLPAVVRPENVASVCAAVEEVMPKWG
ncbi:hypothetical protein N790_07095 [Arenimonas malthae CC-JY-1]|uniref:Capsule polysaccharide biosynthesis protein n=1 Tax=Arenimonas malthae CC-JY-1 TaxID=1384054 RepID=A0A091B5J9_9GAMM|nr:hypothetical protein [Arenimonas malthae]KFN47908.1 hypothetical protein N790_07095 [Arenimonas malthae CC-JY-1]